MLNAEFKSNAFGLRAESRRVFAPLAANINTALSFALLIDVGDDPPFASPTEITAARPKTKTTPTATKVDFDVLLR